MFDRYLVRAACLAVVGALVVGAAGCGDDSDSGGGGASGDGGNGKPTINVGVVGSFSGATSIQPGTPKVMEAWAKSVNAAGGINGSNVRVIVKDVGGSTGAGRAAVQKMIEQDKVVAILAQDANDSQWIKYPETKKVPVILPFSSFSVLLSANAYPVVTGPLGQSYAVADQAKKLGGKLAMGYASEVAALAQYVSTVKTFAKPLGVSVPVATKVSSALPDYTSFCQQVKSSGASSEFLAFVPSVTDKIVAQCVQQGVKAPPILNGVLATPSWKSNAAYDGATVVDFIAPFFDTSLPAVKKYRDALQKYAPGFIGSKDDTSPPLFAWAGGEMLAAAASKAGGSVTAESLQRGLHMMNKETLDGLIAPVTYTAGKTTSVNCWFTWKVSNGQFVAPDGAKSTCAPDAAIAPAEAAVVKSLGG